MKWDVGVFFDLEYYIWNGLTPCGLTQRMLDKDFEGAYRNCHPNTQPHLQDMYDWVQLNIPDVARDYTAWCNHNGLEDIPANKLMIFKLSMKYDWLKKEHMFCTT